MERNYKCFLRSEFKQGDYRLIPIRDMDKYAIMQWRNDQIDILRQKELLTREGQELYFDTVVNKLFETERPNQLLFSFLEKDILIGYGGLVHIDWESGNAEISFITSTDRNVDVGQFMNDWKLYLNLLKELVESELGFVKIYTYAYDIRPKLFEVLLASNYHEEARLRKHIRINEKLHDVVIHSYFCDAITFKVADEHDMFKYFEWVNDSEVRQNSFNIDAIQLADHQKWFLEKINDVDSLLLIAITSEKELGQIRFSKVSTSEYDIDFSVAKDYRGRGVGAKIIRFGLKELKRHDPSIKKIIGKVKENNLPSQRSFQRAGFALEQWDEDKKFYTYSLTLLN